MHSHVYITRGLVVIQFIILWGEHVASSSASVHWCSGFLEGFSVLVLPETLGHKLLDIVVNAEMLGRNNHHIQNKLKKKKKHWDFTVFVF
jgi:hypothetical protein